MALTVIGAGYGRTGTTSLKAALAVLGLGRCYHMSEIQAHPEHVPVWLAASRGEPVDWDALLGPYDATLDWPACDRWRELADRYPEAKVLLSVRDPDAWFDSVMATGYGILRKLHEDAVARGDEEGQRGSQLIMDGRMLDIFPDRAAAIAAFEAHNAAVVAGTDPERLLVYDVREGWEPLCTFLGRPVPAEPFPSENSTRAFWQRPG